MDILRRVTRQIQSADKLARQGKFGEAESQLTAAVALAPDLQLLKEKLGELWQKREQSRPLTEGLHRAIAEARWSDALTAADRLLELSPENRLAMDARRKAWTEVGRDEASLADCGIRYTGVESGVEIPTAQQRFVLWVDGVGGFLVCQSDQVMLGQARPGKSDRRANHGGSVGKTRAHLPEWRRLLDRTTAVGSGQRSRSSLEDHAQRWRRV